MEILGLILSVIFCGITLLASLEATLRLFPESVERTRQHLEQSLGRSLLLGLVNFIFLAVIVFLFVWLGEQLGEVIGGIFSVLALLILVGLTLLLILGVCALSNLVGGRMGEANSPLIAHRYGGLLLILSGLAPFVGWFVFTPLILWTSLGASVQTILRRNKISTPNEA
jgi:hypothetical protein